MVQIAAVIEWMESLAPVGLAEEWDSVGLQCGTPSDDVKGVLTALTVTEDVIEQAVASGASLIVSHHPVIFGRIRDVRTDSRIGSLLYKLVHNGISLYVSHTNLDAAEGGVNDGLASRLRLERCAPLAPRQEFGSPGIGRVGNLPSSLDAKEFADWVKNCLETRVVRLAGEARPAVRKVAVVGGSGGSFVEQARDSGADGLVTGDVDYHDGDEARALGLLVVDVGHFGSEKHVPVDVARYLEARAKDAGERIDVGVAQERDVFWRV